MIAYLADLMSESRWWTLCIVSLLGLSTDSDRHQGARNSQVSTNSLLRRQMVDVGSSDSKSTVADGSAACTGAVSFNRAEVLREARVLEVQDPVSRDGVAEALEAS